jgi:hypothetical protein
MVETEEIKPGAAFGQVHDLRLGRLGCQPELAQQLGQRRQCA